MDKDLLKAKVCAAIDDSAAEIEALANSIADEPELGFKEVKTSAKVAEFMRNLGPTAATPSLTSLCPAA